MKTGVIVKMYVTSIISGSKVFLEIFFLPNVRCVKKLDLSRKVYFSSPANRKGTLKHCTYVNHAHVSTDVVPEFQTLAADNH